jgi:hypothetical protein
MKKQRTHHDDALTRMFRQRLGTAGMPVRDNFWEELQQELPPVSVPSHSRLFVYSRRVAAVAAVALLIGTASTLFFFLPTEEENSSLRQPEATQPLPPLTVENNEPDAPTPAVEAVEKTIHHTPAPRRQQLTANANVHKASLNSADNSDNSNKDEGEDDNVSVTVSITIAEHGYYNGSPTRQAANEAANVTTARSEAARAVTAQTSTAPRPHNWALKAGAGTSLPKGNYHLPLSTRLTAEYRLNKTLSLEAGLQYNYLPAANKADKHSLAIPLQLNVLLASGKHIDLYALAGGAVEKQFGNSTSTDNDNTSSPLLWSVKAGLGIRYKLNKNLAIFAEPTYSHHFQRQHIAASLLTARPDNLNLLCGIRVVL